MLFLSSNFVTTCDPIAAPNLEEEAAKLKDKEGWIKIGYFMKYAVTTELCKVEFVDRVFHKTDPEEELKNKSKDGAAKKGKVNRDFFQMMSIRIYRNVYFK